jgi:pyruvate dehydrogenase E1 component
MAGTARTLDVDAAETAEWAEALEAVLERDGAERAHFLLETLIDKARRSGAYLPYTATTAYVNTIPPGSEARSPGDAALEWRIRSIIRWNAMAIVLNANRETPGLGGHIASFASAATLYDVGFNHFFHGPPFSRGGSPKRSSVDFGARSAAAGSLRIRTRGSCASSGSFRPCPWGWRR